MQLYEIILDTYKPEGKTQRDKMIKFLEDKNAQVILFEICDSF